MNIPVALPLDNDGFLRRECPTCLRQFKWHNGPANEEAEQQAPADSYFCPFCAQAALPDQWLTTEQVDHVRGVAIPAAIKSIDDALSEAFKGFKSKNIKVTKTGHLNTPDEPNPLTEADDMMIIASPCHSWEPIKVPDETASPVHCIVCGQAFAI
ncbi:hypothetical protein [Glaciibacter psychrotolerans]|uniref:Endogenous inhibitor of DNA gyrase (YacG/DUF329 family) n=1 Tax=Glaciibacter psychrotolerans TaxID=670054 RepID=A0A7Z0ECK3_9MICO|nr:hypothetical protein [Leifsonia psychrotolerans]NYJ18524.1 endogenous inhibitor of DNA gyrase (YacG/DUF329 family) [Leifsonia psychrotolerans]